MERINIRAEVSNADRIAESIYSRSVAEREAKNEIEVMLKERYPGFDSLPTNERINKMRELLRSLSQTEGDSPRPLNNENRDLVEKLSEMINDAESLIVYETLTSKNKNTKPEYLIH